MENIWRAHKFHKEKIRGWYRGELWIVIVVKRSKAGILSSE